MVHTYIRFHQDCKSLQQGIGEMALFLQYWTIIMRYIGILTLEIYELEIHIIYIIIQNTGAREAPSKR